MKTLVIVESPTKAKTISKFLGKGYTVISSFGHVRDLPKRKMGVDIEGGTFEPEYVVPKEKNSQVKEIKKLAEKNDTVIFATDEDREGEAISWHLAHILHIKPEKAERMVFHEITQHAIDEALKHPRTLDMKLVDAQQARRVLDRLVGYELSPLLWKKVARGLSAGRVQSVAVRLVVEREREIQAFVTQEYWSINGLFRPKSEIRNQKSEIITAELHSLEGKRLDKLDIKSKTEVDEIVKKLESAAYSIVDIGQKEMKRTPPPPFITSTLQQHANYKLGYSASYAMRLSQQLYETGFITYMRTDSTYLSEKFIGETRNYAAATYGKKYALDGARVYKKKTKGAQEAHEAIRPTDPSHTPESIKTHLSPQQYKLYDLIWKRAVATQMADARLNKTLIDIEGGKALFRATGQTMIFPGWMKLYPELIREEMLPELPKGTPMACTELKPEQHFTEPPARYSDATLVKVLEEHGIGRPSTYAPTIDTIEKRRYVLRDENKRLKPTDIGIMVNDVLVEHFSTIVDYTFTATMEENLDAIAEGKKDWQPIIATFYHPFHELIIEKTDTLSKKEITEETTDEKCEKCGSPMVIKMGRFGKFMACSNYPECKTTKQIDENNQPIDETTNEICEKCGKPMMIKHGRFGAFLGCSGYPDCKNIKRIEKKTGVACNLCGKGEFVEKRSKRGKIFYSCNQYPECKNALWSKPTGDLCPQCQHPIVLGAKDTVKCSNKECV